MDHRSMLFLGCALVLFLGLTLYVDSIPELREELRQEPTYEVNLPEFIIHLDIFLGILVVLQYQITKPEGPP